MITINEEKLEELLEDLKDQFDVFDMRKHILPFKKYLLPPVFETISSDEKGKNEVPEAPKNFILFGLSLADLEALQIIDEVMSKPNEDYYYWLNRKQAIIVGLTSKEAGENFGGDITLQNVDGGNFKIFTHTKKGDSLVKRKMRFFKKTKEENDSVIPIAENDWSSQMQELLLDSELLAKAVEWSKDHKIWDELAEKCLGCGICTYVCPICYCFSIEDSVHLDGKCSRCRKWDACTLPEFSKIAGGHSFRPTIKERYYNWFFHKFVRAYNENGKSQCVGCGRCKRFCPAGIDIYEILERILSDYQKVNKISN